MIMPDTGAPGRKARNSSQDGKFDKGAGIDKRDSTNRRRIESKSRGSFDQPLAGRKKHVHYDNQPVPKIPDSAQRRSHR